MTTGRAVAEGSAAELAEVHRDGTGDPLRVLFDPASVDVVGTSGNPEK